MTNTQTIPAEVLEDLATADEFAAAAATCYEVTWAMLEQRKAELAEAQERFEQANTAWEVAARANDLAQQKQASLRRAEGLVLTADGYQLAKTP